MMHFLASLFISSLLSTYAIGFAIQQPRSFESSLFLRDDAPTTFGYYGKLGPLAWATLDKKWAACSTDVAQSPININSASATTSDQPVISIQNLPSAPFFLKNHVLQVDLAGKGGKTQIGGKSYDLQQFHFHTTSEHFIDEEYYLLEMHLVHTAPDNSTLVLAALFDISTSPSPALISNTIQHLDDVSGGKQTTTGPLDFNDIVNHFQTSPLYHYTGSLTAPPCTPGVSWIVSTKTIQINLDDFQKMKHLMKYSARYIQDNPNLIQTACVGPH